MGPTGSGKSTTIYSILTEINEPSRNVVTVEDPVEYDIPGIKQTQVHTKIDYTFAAGLRAILRADPDVIVVGEIRDTETAHTAAKAALTGHLVLSTLHANDAATAIAPAARDEPRALPGGVVAHLRRRPAARAPAVSALPGRLHNRTRTSGWRSWR